MQRTVSFWSSPPSFPVYTLSGMRLVLSVSFSMRQKTASCLSQIKSIVHSLANKSTYLLEHSWSSVCPDDALKVFIQSIVWLIKHKNKRRRSTGF